jgi:hypothetical protein
MRFCVLALLLWPVLYGQDVPITTLKQIGSFTLPNNPTRISRIASGGGVLWFLLTNGNWSELLATDVAGGNPNQFAVRPPTKRSPSPINAICASGDGRIAVGRADGTLEIYSRLGDVTETIAFDQHGASCVLDQNLWVRSATGIDVASGARSGFHIELPNLPKYAQVDLLGLADHAIGFLESTEGVFYMLSQQTGDWLRHPLNAPEFQVIRRMPAQENAWSPVVMSPSVVGGEFYVLSNPTNRKQGAKVLRFDSQGNLRARYLCPLPTSVAAPTGLNPNGYLFPTSMVVMDRTLLLISGSQRVVASYSLD